MTATIGYDTAQNTPGLITVFESTEAGDAEYPISNMLDYTTNTIGRILSPADDFFTIQVETSAPILANYIGVAEHNLPIGTKARFTDRTSGSSVTLGAVDVVNQGPLLLAFENQTTTANFRIGFELPGGAGLAVNIGSLFFGVRTDLPEPIPTPYRPPPLGRDTKLYPSIAAKGSNFLGSYVERVGWDFSIEQKLVDPQWIDSNWIQMARHFEALPFFFAWDIDQPEDTVYGWTTSINAPRYTNPVHMGWSVKCRGLHVP